MITTILLLKFSTNECRRSWSCPIPDAPSFQMHQQFIGSMAPQFPDHMAVGMTPALPSPPPSAPPLQRPMVIRPDTELSRVFDDDEYMAIPSPPPLPEDFSVPPAPQQHPILTPYGNTGGMLANGNTMLFNFGQFSQRMPQSQPVLVGSSQLVKDLSQEAMDMVEANMVYETHDDGDLMQLLFGVANEMPTMATTHLHKFPSPVQPSSPVNDGVGPSQLIRPAGPFPDAKDFSTSFVGRQQAAPDAPSTLASQPPMYGVVEQTPPREPETRGGGPSALPGSSSSGTAGEPCAKQEWGAVSDLYAQMGNNTASITQRAATASVQYQFHDF